MWRAISLLFLMTSCQLKPSAPSQISIDELELKKGNLISCGSPDKEFGKLIFEISCNKSTKANFNLAVELLHSFEYDEAEKIFAKIIDAEPACAMAYWGVAMCSYHPLWEPPTEADLTKGSRAIQLAKNISSKSDREADYINALATYYEDWAETDPRTRSLKFEQAMEKLYAKYPKDAETAIFYALALNAAASPADQLYTKQKKAGAILDSLYEIHPNHPGIIHYVIHTYDYPGIATLGLAAAKRYATVAPSSAHALHMPSHIFTRLGMWDECIRSNQESVAAAKCYAETAGIKGHWDEELHGLDYLVYAYLQKGDNVSAREQLKYLASIKQVFPINFKVAYCFAAAPARMALENKYWDQASRLEPAPADFPWQNFLWQKAIIHFARLLGAVHLGIQSQADLNLKNLYTIYATLKDQKENYKANQVAIQIKASEGWISYSKGRKKEALDIMESAANMEDSTSKHPVTPGEVLPARELYADMLFITQQYENALNAYEKVLEKNPNRFNSLFGAGAAAEKSGLNNKALNYFKQLVSMVDSGSNRPELKIAAEFLKKHS